MCERHLVRGVHLRPQRRVLTRGREVAVHEHVLQQGDVVQLVHPEQPVDVLPVVSGHERQRRQPRLQQRDVGGDPRSALVDVRERLQVREVHQDEEGLLERIRNGRGLVEEHLELRGDIELVLQGQVGGTADTHGQTAQPAAEGRVVEQSVREQCVYVKEGAPIDRGLREMGDHVLDRILVIQDHQGFGPILAVGKLARLDQSLGLQDLVGIAFHARRGPRQIHQQAREDASRVGARRKLLYRRSRGRKPRPIRPGEIPGLARNVAVEERMTVANGRPTVIRHLQVGADPRGIRQSISGSRPSPDYRQGSLLDKGLQRAPDCRFASVGRDAGPYLAPPNVGMSPNVLENRLFGKRHETIF